jgi:hypothetical protein
MVNIGARIVIPVLREQIQRALVVPQRGQPSTRRHTWRGATI